MDPVLDIDTAPARSRMARDVVFEYLAEMGISYIFGNPGTTELPFVDGVNDHPSIEYVLSMHEDVAVAQAMGYARASGKIGVVSLHVAPGVGHGLGNLYNAFRARVPLLITAGQHHTGLMVQEPILTADLASLVRPFTKWAYEVTLPEELPIALQRAFKELTTPPYGPVFLSFPMNLLMEEYESFAPARVSHIPPTVATAETVTQAAQVLVEARRPVVVAGDGVGHGDAWAEAVAIAEAIGARVYAEGYATLWNFPADHPLFAGSLSNRADLMREQLAEFDTLLLLGVTAQVPVSRYDGGGPLLPWGLRTVCVDDSPWEMGKNQPVEVGLLGDVRRNLAALVGALGRANLDTQGAAARVAAESALTFERRAAWAAKVDEAQTSDGSVTALGLAAELRDLLPEDAIFVDETISNRPSFVGTLRFPDPQSYYAGNGLSLGYSGGVAAGIQLARSDRKVVRVVGDGSLMYYPQALWNDVNRQLPVFTIVLNNGAYRVLKQIVDRMGGPWSRTGQMPESLDLGGPHIDFSGLARSMGVPAERVEVPGDLRKAIQRGLESDGPYLLEVILDQ